MMRDWFNTIRQETPSDETDLTWDHTWPFNPDSPVIEGTARTDRPLAIMLVDLTGLEWHEIEPLLPLARSGAAAQEMLPLLVVDLLDFSALRHAGFAFDVLPNAAANLTFRPDHDWSAYLARRRRLMAEKWKPAAIVRLSEHAGVWE